MSVQCSEKKCKLNLNLKSGLDSKIQLHWFLQSRREEKEIIVLKAKETFYTQKMTSYTDPYQLPLTVQITSSFHLGLQIACGRFLGCQIKPEVHFMYLPSSKDVWPPTHFLYNFPSLIQNKKEKACHESMTAV